MSVVVRCPGCRGESRVGPEVVGQLVLCPRCGGPFVAVEEAVPVVRAAEPVRPAARSPSERTVVGRPASGTQRSRRQAEPIAPPSKDAEDPHSDLAPGGLPISVLIGLALLPFVIPLLWLLAPLVVGPPDLSLAAPTALAVAASALCLAVVYTVDWSPVTRVKGVLTLVGLAYSAGIGLYVLDKGVIDRAKAVFVPNPEWTV